MIWRRDSIGRLGGGLAMDCLSLSIDPVTKLLVSTRPVFGGNAHATMVSKSVRPQMATIRPKTVPAAERNDPGRVRLFL